ncbi:sensor domain-containing protein [Halorientalis brevis]|uniref:Sensor domain-containing protein n=1 Tax=Halorientalis brevis TaxID=1126241 RepID=A0ABD6CE01_9EURY|nr:sensor domain-containing protein [Halorientalis brevis]
MDQPRTDGTVSGSTIADGVRPLTEAQTYKNLLYLVLTFPLGLAYFVIVVVGFALGLGLSVLLVGLGILLATGIGLRVIASFERRLANTLLGTEITAPTDVEQTTDGLIETVTAYFEASSTWRGLGFVLLKFWLGILSLILLITFLGTAIELTLLPLFTDGVLNVQVVGWRVAHSFQTPTQRLLAVPGGVVLGIVAVHILNAYARTNASIAVSLLGPTRAPANADRSRKQSE